MTDLKSVTYYLSMWIEWNCTKHYSSYLNSLHLQGSTYFCQNEVNSVNTFMNSDVILTKKFNKQTDIIIICHYQWAIDSLMYIMLLMYFDIVFAVFSVSQFV
jgi:hypothetical protein